MSPLESIIKNHIAQNGPITVAEYMELALQHPEYGYYRSGDVLGRGGDFITAPEVSQMFGEMIGLWCAAMWQQLGKPDDFTLLELGPGRGTLMQDALRATTKIPGFHNALKLHLLESNTTFRAMQKEKFGNHKPAWLDNLTQIPKRPLIIIANEFFDALPIRQFEKTFSGWQEKCVDVKDNNFVWGKASIPDRHSGQFSFRTAKQGERKLIRNPSFSPQEQPYMDPGFAASPRPRMTALIDEVLSDDAKVGTVIEISPPSLLITKHLARHVAEYGGAMLVIDYGYSESSGASTLQALSKHAYANVLENPGQQDITAHVDFGAIKRAAQEANCTDIITQGDFLRNMGIEFRAAMLRKNASAEQAAAIDAALHRLTHVDEMGSLFKVLAITSRNIETVVGF